MNQSIDDLRKEINTLDETIKSALKRRFEVTDAVGAYKREHDLPMLDTNREKQILDLIEDASIRKIYEVILRESKARQKSE